MKQEKVRHSGAINGTSVNYLPERPLQKQSLMEKEYTKDGTRYYKSLDGKTFDADTYDKIFGVNRIKAKVLPKRRKPMRDGGLGRVVHRPGSNPRD